MPSIKCKFCGKVFPDTDSIAAAIVMEDLENRIGDFDEF